MSSRINKVIRRNKRRCKEAKQNRPLTEKELKQVFQAQDNTRP
jgi:hypothetical protein